MIPPTNMKTELEKIQRIQCRFFQSCDERHAMQSRMTNFSRSTSQRWSQWNSFMRYFSTFILLLIENFHRVIERSFFSFPFHNVSSTVFALDHFNEWISFNTNVPVKKDFTIINLFCSNAWWNFSLHNKHNRNENFPFLIQNSHQRIIIVIDRVEQQQWK